ncbi:hypothetical protein COCCADRAFT_23629 [Bipolaris zeicola 26-R-13]|uniref:Uncharacterized protein n=1 Tax=Cochliobolus carbonum (strain 26-R-13) TaxID=930089 RepID=W6YMJ8_COCC2|nr:uncharacterized protein COCCADRAFT_23629 [Bipolaris zeicola 26-R-13]EUC36694.1 hypothetical protein COCCADRAFT_23629 [Bipolaris zeicola 26-R-13]
MSLPGIGHSFTGHSTPFSDTVNGRPDRWCAHSNDRVGLVTRHTTRAIQRVLRRKIHFFFLLPIVTSPVTVPTAASTSMGAQIACQDVGCVEERSPCARGWPFGRRHASGCSAILESGRITLHAQSKDVMARRAASVAFEPTPARISAGCLGPAVTSLSPVPPLGPAALEC